LGQEFVQSGKLKWIADSIRSVWVAVAYRHQL